MPSALGRQAIIATEDGPTSRCSRVPKVTVVYKRRPMSKSSINTQARSSLNTLCWQGWRLDLPARWNPVKVEGDYDSGSVLIADLHRPRLGLRWHRATKKLDSSAWVMEALREEVGQLAADEAKPFAAAPGEFDGSMLYVEPQPPGRDVWLGESRVSGRCIEVVHHAHRRENLLASMLLPTLKDLPADQPMPWSVFDLSCIAPTGFRLLSHRLNAGDLSLTFGQERRLATIRQIALADLALKRMSLQQWLGDQEQMQRKHYRPVGKTSEPSIAADDGRNLCGVLRRMVRRRRFCFMRSIACELLTAALRDNERDRLVIVQASDEPLLRESAAHVGWASADM